MHDALRQHLHDLPDAAPSDALWTRINGARQKQLGRRRGVIAGGTAACTMLVATLFFSFGHRGIDRTAAPGVAATPINAAPVASPESLHRIDRELQLAYARNADDAELASLWAVRRDILQSRTENVQPLGI